MNGASADVCANTSSAPTSSNTIIIGSSHHFLRVRANAQTSRSTLRDVMLDLLELMLHVAAVLRTRHTPALRPRRPHYWIVPPQPPLPPAQRDPHAIHDR